MTDILGAEAQIPYKSYSEIEWEVNNFLEQNWTGNFPIDVDEICDKLGINVIYIPNLRKQFSLEAYTTSDFKTIIVDEEITQNNTEYQFCVAHELGHIALHKEYYPSNITDLETYLKYANGYVCGPAESQADIFASALLVPGDALKDVLISSFGNNIERSIEDMNLPQITKTFSGVAEYFGVSALTLRKRMEYAFPNVIKALKAL